jgi:hypothetical protein
MKPTYIKEDIQKALNYMENSYSIRNTALEFRVPCFILQDRTNSCISRQEAYMTRGYNGCLQALQPVKLL